MARKRIDAAVKVDPRERSFGERDTDDLATKIAEKIVAALTDRFVDTLAQRIVYHQRTAGLTDEEYARRCLEDGGWQPTQDGWSPPRSRSSRRYTITMVGLPACVVMPSKPPPKCPCVSCARARRVGQLLSNMVRGEVDRPDPKQSGQPAEPDRNEQIRLAYNERARGDRRELEARAKKRRLTTDEAAALSLLSGGHRLMPNARDRLALTTPLKIDEKQRPRRPTRTT